MSAELEIAGHQARIRIEVLGYENPSACEASDANWLACKVEVHVGPVSGKLEAAFTTQDFAAFAKALRSIVTDVQGSATFETDEDVLRVVVEMKPLGSAQVSGVLKVIGQPQASLSFSFESDQSFLSRAVDDLGEITRQFPVRHERL